MPSISVITPTYNRRELLAQTAQGLMTQTFTDFEWVVAIDGSTDDTAAYLQLLKPQAHFSIVVLQLENGGQARARNAAIRAATGSVLVFCDDDVVLAPDCLAKHAEFQATHTGAVAVGPVKNASDGRTDFPTVVTWMNFTGMNVSLHWVAIIDAGLFDESFSGYGGEDLDVGIRLKKNNCKFYPLPHAHALHLAPAARDEHKGRMAGEAAMRLAKKHGSVAGMMLGVHPIVLVLKSMVFNKVGEKVFGQNQNYSFERAYFIGAKKELKHKNKKEKA